MHHLLLNINLTDSLTLYGGGAVVLGSLSVLLFIVALFPKRPRKSKQSLPEQKPVIGPAPEAMKPAAAEESIVQIDEDDPRMAAAVIEAKKRLPEFVKAFSKAKDGYQFSIKAPFTDPGNAEESEFMWVHVSRVDWDAVHGTLLNEPELVKSYKYDDVVRVPMELIVDWVYSDGEKSVGDFTARVLDEAAKSAKAALPPPHSSQPAQTDSSFEPPPSSNPQ